MYLYENLIRNIKEILEFLKVIYFCIEGYLLYRILLSSVKPKHGSAIGIRTFPPF